MTTETLDIQDTVSRLMEVCHEAASAFASASKTVPLDELLLKRELMRYSRQWGQFAAQLECEMDQPHGRTSMPGLLHRDWFTHMLHAHDSNHRAAILSECEYLAELMAAAYQEAQTVPLPSPITDLVHMQARVINRVHERIQLLHEACQPNN